MSNFINLGFPTMIRKARWAAVACTNGEWRGLDAMLYSAFAIEAFVNDFATMGALLDVKLAPIEVRTAVKALVRAESKRKPTLDKAIVLHRRLTGTKPDKGKEPLQKLSLLFELRDQIVHSRADVVTGQVRAARVAKLIERLNQQGNLIPKNLRLLVDWRFMLDQSPGVANWSLATAREIACWIRDACPDSKLKKDWLVGATGPRSAMFGDY